MIDLTGYKLTFDDEFNQRSISQGAGTTWSDIRQEWRYDAQSDIGYGTSSFVDAGSGYDPFNVNNGALTITAVHDKTGYGYPGSWESGLITTQHSFSQTYGYFEMRADLSESPGAWDAFWLMPDKQTNATSTNWQELDVVEHYGSDPASTYRWIHTTDPTSDANAERQVTSHNPEQTSGYHTYGMDWQQDQISFYFDGQFMGSKPTPSDMHSPMYMIANLATQDGATDPSMAMKIDYIRAYSSDPNAHAVTADTVSAPDGHDPGYYGATVGGSATTATQTASPSLAATSPTLSAATDTQHTTDVTATPSEQTSTEALTAVGSTSDGSTSAPHTSSDIVTASANEATTSTAVISQPAPSTAVTDASTHVSTPDAVDASLATFDTLFTPRGQQTAASARGWDGAHSDAHFDVGGGNHHGHDMPNYHAHHHDW